MQTPTRFGIPAENQLVASAAGVVGGVALIVLSPDFGVLLLTIIAWVATAVSLIFLADACRTIVAAEDEADRNSNGEHLP